MLTSWLARAGQRRRGTVVFANSSYLLHDLNAVLLNHGAAKPQLMVGRELQPPAGPPGGGGAGVPSKARRSAQLRALGSRKQRGLMLATDMLSRGVDIRGLSHVVNYGLPRDPEGYVHRAGRVGRESSLRDLPSVVVSVLTAAEHATLEAWALEHEWGIAITAEGG